MAGSFNHITIVGYAGRDPETRSLPDGTAVCDFSMATNERRRGEEDHATWFRISVFGRQAEFVRDYVHKGSHLYVEGRVSQREYTSREGVAKTSLEVRASDIQILDKREDNGAGSGRQPVSKAEVASADRLFDSEVPF